MSRDLEQIFDLEQLRRAWGDASGQAAVASPKPGPKRVPAPPASSPSHLLEALGQALIEEFGQEREPPRFRPLLEALRPLVGSLETRELTAERRAALTQHLDELEDLIDALSLPAASAS